MSGNDYAYSVARIRSLERSLLDTVTRQRLMDASVEDVPAILAEAGVFQGELDIREGEAIEKALEERLAETLRLLIGVSPDPEFFRWVARRYDVHNLKRILKAHHAGLDSPEDAALSPLGIEDPASLRAGVCEERRQAFSREMLEIHDAARSRFERFGVPAALDIGCDSAYWSGFRLWAERRGDAWHRTWVRLHITLQNLGALLRAGAGVWPVDLVRAAVLEGGELDTGTLRSLAGQTLETATERLAGTHFAEAFAAAARSVRETDRFLAWEKASHERLMKAFEASRYETLSSGPLVAYWLMREAEARFLRTVIMGKRCGLSREQLTDLEVAIHV